MSIVRTPLWIAMLALLALAGGSIAAPAALHAHLDRDGLHPGEQAPALDQNVAPALPAAAEGQGSRLDPMRPWRRVLLPARNGQAVLPRNLALSAACNFPPLVGGGVRGMRVPLPLRSGNSDDPASPTRAARPGASKEPGGEGAGASS